MLSIREISKEEIVTFFTNDPKLAFKSLADEILDYMYHGKDIEFHRNSNVLGLFINDELIVIFKYQHFSNVAVNVHLYIATKARSKEFFNGVFQFLKAWVKEKHPHVCKAVVITPSTCKHVLKLLPKYGFKLEGTIEKAMKWRLEIVDIHILGMEL